MTISPQDLTAEQRARVDFMAAAFYVRDSRLSVEQCYKAALTGFEDLSAHSRALFAPESEQLAQAEVCPNCKKAVSFLDDHFVIHDADYTCQPAPVAASIPPWLDPQYGNVDLGSPQPAPVAAGEMPEAVRDAAFWLNQVADGFPHDDNELRALAERVHREWRAQAAAQPGKKEADIRWQESSIALRSLCERAANTLARYLPPDGICKDEALNELLGIFDGPDQRSAFSLHDAMVHLGRGSR